ncbi:transcription initiation factor TFIID subunit 12 [Trichonephila clavipes]|nr:transcription initiation factor TFIID subunit 12 [Trichonephila clavipes]
MAFTPRVTLPGEYSSAVLRPFHPVTPSRHDETNTQASGTETLSTNASVISVCTVPSSVPSTPVTSQNSVSTGLSVSLLPPESAQVAQVLNKQRLQDLVREVDPNVQTDEETDELAEDFIEDVVETSCSLAKHRKSNVLEIKDVQLALEKDWNMWIPGFGTEELRPYKKSFTTEAHKQRLALIRKTLKK